MSSVWSVRARIGMGLAVCVLALAGALDLGAARARADTQVSGHISANTTWGASGSPYVISSTATVDAGATLTIQPGTTVEFSGQLTSLNVNGDILAVGTQASPIIFTSVQGAQGTGAPGQYSGVNVSSGDAASRFSYTTFRYGGYGTGGYYNGSALDVSNHSTVHIDHGDFEHNQQSGLGTGTGSSIVSYSTFANNGDGISAVGGAPGPLTLTHSTLQNNTGDGAFFNITSDGPGSSFSYDTITGNGQHGINMQVNCTMALSTYPHGEWNNIYANNTAAEGADQLSTTTANCNALAVDWSNNYWGSDVYYYNNPSGCFPGAAAAGHLAYTWSSSQYIAPDGPISNRKFGGNGTSACSVDSFAISQFQSSLIPTAGASPTSPLPTLSGSALYGGPVNEAAPNVPKPQCADPVECGIGNLYESHSDLQIPGWNGGLSLTRSYNSQAAANATAAGPFGYGWSFNFGASLSVDPTGAYATVTQSDGSTVTFVANGDGTYSAPAWVQATIIHNADGSWTYSLPDLETMKFDSSGRLVSASDPNGNTTSLSYTSGQLTSVTDAAGQSLQFSYNPQGQVSQITDPASRTVKYQYDASGNLREFTDVGGHTWHYFNYDSSHQLGSIEDPRNATVSNTYDAQHRVISQSDPLNRTTTWSYNTNDTQITDPAGDVTDMQFSGGEPTSIAHGYGTSSAATTTMAYDANGNPTSVTDPNTHTTTYGYDAQGNRTSVTDARNRTTSYTYDAKRNLLTRTLPSGLKTTNAYDANGNLTQVTRTLTETGQQQTTTLGYDSHGDLTSVTDPLNHTTTYGYDAQGDRTSATTPLGNKTTWTYDAIGGVRSETTARGNVQGANASAYTTSYTLNAFENPTLITDPAGKQTQLGYDVDQNLVSRTDRDNHTTGYTYDLDGELTQTTLPDTSTQKTTYGPDGRIATQIDGLGKTTAYGYDPLGRVTSVTDPLNRTRNFGYDPASNQTSITDAAGRTTTLGYDAANELTSISYSSGNPGNASFTYTPDGVRATVTDPTGTTTLHYDSLDRLTSNTSGAGQSTGYGYDLANELTSIAYPPALSALNLTSGGTQTQNQTGTVTRGYDNDGRLHTVTDWLGHTSTFSYDPEADLTNTARANGTSAAYTYDTNNLLSSLTEYGTPATTLMGVTGTLSAGAAGLGSATTYTRSPEGILTAITPGVGVAQNLGYDQKDRLTSVSSGAYTYDAADHPTQILSGTSTLTQAFDAAGQLTTQSNGGSQTAGFTYNAQGERTGLTPTSGTASSYTYDQAGQLINYQGPDHSSLTGAQASAQYTYDASGLRQTKTVNNTLTNEVWDLADGLALMIEDGPNAYVTGPDGLPLEQITPGGTVSYYAHDQQGSTTILTDQNGATQATSTYDAYGNPTNTPTVTQPFGYDGQYTDPETGLQYLRARYYDPTTSQFLTPDPLLAHTRDPYGYAADSPTNAGDPTGLCFGLGYCPGVDDVGNAVSSLVSSGADALAPVGNGIAGVADGFTAGLSTTLLNAVGIHPDKCSTSFRVGQVAGAVAGAFTIGGKIFDGLSALRAGRAAEDASAFVGRQGVTETFDDGTSVKYGGPINIADGTNAPGKVYGRSYSGHAFDRMQGRGIPPSAVEEAINNPASVSAGRGGTTIYRSSDGVTAVVSGSGRVVTVW
jgi:RHS repeat-associated protein